MEKLNNLLEISETLNLKDITERLSTIKKYYENPNAELILPLVGEFSSGKTTLINALTDSKKLETATIPTTATIFRIHFGSDKFHAKVLDANGEWIEKDDVEELTNENLEDATWVDVFDTSTRIPSTIVLVDTPGLSSPNPRHKETLAKSLPTADGVLVVIDINQQITKSLQDFIKMTELIKCPIFVVLTKSDTKSPEAIEAVKKYIKQNNISQIKEIVCVSALKEDLGELYSLFDKIEKEKGSILKQVNDHRVKTIVTQMTSNIDELLKASSSDKDLEEAIRDQESELDKLNCNINRLIDSTTESIRETEKNISREFEDLISERLERTITDKSDNYDSAAIATINNTATLLFSNYKNEIKEVLSRSVSNRRNTEDEIYLRSLEDLDFSNLESPQLSYNLDLNSAGHEQDKLFTNVIKVVAVAAVVAAVVVTAGAAAPAVEGATAAGGAVAKAGGAAVAKEGAKAITKRALIEETIKETLKAKAKEMVGSSGKKENEEEKDEQKEGLINQPLIDNTTKMVDTGGGFIQLLVSKATDASMGKPQRKRMIRNYMEESLAPKFIAELKRIRLQLISLISDALHKEAEDTINQKTEILKQLKSDSKEKKDIYENRIKQLRDYKKTLITL